MIAAALALLAALSFLRHKDILVDEAGGRANISSRGSGYRLWVASMATQLINSTLWGITGLCRKTGVFL